MIKTRLRTTVPADLITQQHHNYSDHVHACTRPESLDCPQGDARGVKHRLIADWLIAPADSHLHFPYAMLSVVKPDRFVLRRPRSAYWGR